MNLHKHLADKSLRGEWISVARDWLSCNGPCTKHEYLCGVRKYMPTFITNQSTGKRYSQKQLAASALVRVAKQDENGLWFVEDRKSSKGFTKQILDLASKQPTVSHSDFPDMKKFSTLAGNLVTRGLLVRASKGVYSLAAEHRPTEIDGE